MVLPIIEANNLELVDVEYVKEGSDYYLRIYADKEGGITIGDCEIKTYTKIDNCKDFEGELTAYDEETVTILTEDEKELKIARKDISMIRLAFVY